MSGVGKGENCVLANQRLSLCSAWKVEFRDFSGPTSVGSQKAEIDRDLKGEKHLVKM